ncbi:hypothetical protein AGMMS49983_01170 [Clostridia bacterium]|nr:hypothetical protein AGMMS49983_01170 [Clostridia bacterium]
MGCALKAIFIAIAVCVVVAVIYVGYLLLFDEPEIPDYGNAFAPPSAQSGSEQTGSRESGSSQFSDALDEILAGGGFAGHAGSGETAPGGADSDDAYYEFYDWTDEEWEMFFSYLAETLDEDELNYLLSLDDEELMSFMIEVLNEK